MRLLPILLLTIACASQVEPENDCRRVDWCDGSLCVTEVCDEPKVAAESYPLAYCSAGDAGRFVEWCSTKTEPACRWFACVEPEPGDAPPF